MVALSDSVFWILEYGMAGFKLWGILLVTYLLHLFELLHILQQLTGRARACQASIVGNI